MYKSDIAFIYKQKEDLLFAITKNHGKIIIKNNYFYNKYGVIKTFFFINYEFELSDMHHIQNTEKVILKKSYLEIEKTVDLLLLDTHLYQLMYILDRCILCKMDTEDIFNIIENFFLFLNTVNKKDIAEDLFYDLYSKIFLVLNLIDPALLKKHELKKLIKEKLIEIFNYDIDIIQRYFDQ